MENGIETKLEQIEAGKISIYEAIQFLFQSRDDNYFQSHKGNNRLKDMFELNSDIDFRCVLVYLILNYSDLEDSWHEKLADFSLDNINRLNNTQNLPALYRDNDLMAYEYLTGRIFNPNYVKSKKWIYILSLPFDNNKVLVGRMLKDIEKASIPFDTFLPYPISARIARLLIKKYNYE